MQQRDQPGSPWREPERVDASSKSWSWGATYSKTHVYLHPDNAISLKHVLQHGSHNQALETSDDRKIAMEAVMLGGGVLSHY